MIIHRNAIERNCTRKILQTFMNKFIYGQIFTRLNDTALIISWKLGMQIQGQIRYETFNDGNNKIYSKCCSLPTRSVRQIQHENKSCQLSNLPYPVAVTSKTCIHLSSPSALVTESTIPSPQARPHTMV